MSLTSRRWAIAWAAFAVALLTAAAGTLLGHRAWVAAVDASLATHNATWDAMSKKLSALDGADEATVRKVLNDGRPIPESPRQVPDGLVLRWFDPNTSVTFDLLFRDGRLGMWTVPGRGPSWSSPPEPWYVAAPRRYARGVMLAGMFGFAVWLPIVFNVSRPRRAVAHLALMGWAAAIVAACLVAAAGSLGFDWEAVFAALAFGSPNLFVLLAANDLDRRDRKSRSRRDECRACGYKLMGNTSGVCPECGTPTDREHLVAEQERVVRAVEALEHGRPPDR